MLGGLLKLALSFSILLLFVTLTWQASIADALPVRKQENFDHRHRRHPSSGILETKSKLCSVCQYFR